MINAEIRVYGNLNDFLPPNQQQRSFTRTIPRPTSVKDLLEGAGIPHPEIGAVTVDGSPVRLDTLVEKSSRVAAYPMFGHLDKTGLPCLRPTPPEPAAFALDTHLGKLTRHLRLLGYDTSYNTHASDDRLAQLAASGRILLTRDRQLLMRKSVQWGYFVRAENPEQQLNECVWRFDLVTTAKPFTRCLACNGRLIAVDNREIEHQLQPLTRQHFDEFWQCQNCQRIYWRGSHYDRLAQILHRVVQGASDSK